MTIPSFAQKIVLLFYSKENRAAYRLGLRDKGEVGYVVENSNVTQLVCSNCQTVVRIGINKKNLPCKYCWRCESLISTRKTNPRGGGKPLPKSADRNSGENVVPLKRIR